MRCKINIFITLCLLLSGLSIACAQVPAVPENEIKVGAQQLDVLLPLIKNKKVGLVINQTSTVDNTLLIDTLHALGIKITGAFAPEHGVRGQADAGAKVGNEVDKKTGVPVFSIYGSNKKPTPDHLKNMDVIIFDIQDVGARFYTYISTLHYVMEAAAENGKQVIVLDRPNPNGHYVDGPILEKANTSFVGMHTIPVVHGMTVGEYAKMINGEKWLKNSVQCQLSIIPVLNYDHQTFYSLPIAPSPNLPNMRSIYLYPSLCFFEGTPFSVGRGTSHQFQLWGHPLSTIKDTTFTPESRPGATNPPLLGKKSYGKAYTDLSDEELKTFGFSLQPIIEAYQSYKGQDFFNNFFIKLAGTSQLQDQIKAGLSEEEIRQSWVDDIEKFKNIRKKYLLYPDFE